MDKDVRKMSKEALGITFEVARIASNTVDIAEIEKEINND